MTGDELEPVATELVQESPGTYSGEMTVEQPGSFLLSLEDGSGQNVAMPTGLIVPYSPEYRIETGDAERELQRLADMTGGRVLSWDLAGGAVCGASAPEPSSCMISVMRCWPRP